MTHIPLHPQFGLNPTIPTCCWCGSPKSEVALLGAKYRQQAPLTIVLDYEPCEKCKARMGQGVTCIEVGSAEQLKRQPLARDGAMSTVAPTGRWVVVAMEAVSRLPFQPDMVEKITEARRAIVERDVFTMLFGELTEEKQDDQADELLVQDGGAPGVLDADTGLPLDAQSPRAEGPQPAHG